MTKTLFLLRHGKSDWSKGNESDHERTLNAVGKGEVSRIAAWLKRRSLSPGRVISSPAVRARDTAFIVMDELGMKRDAVTLEENLYLAEPPAYMNVLTHLSQDPPTVLLVGHNPGMSELATRICSESIEMPTAALLEIALSISQFSELDFSTSAQLIHFLRPSEL